MDIECKVSVCCLTYNHEKYIAQALDSMVEQKTNFKYEIIVLDDASKDRTQDIIKEYCERYPETIRCVLQKENQFSQKVPIVNKFFYPLARGQYIAYCEGDDYWTNENKLQEQADFLDRHPEYVACSHECWEVNEDGEKITDYYFNGCYKKHYDLKLHCNWQILSGQTATLMHRKSAYEIVDQEALNALGKLKITGDVKKTAVLVLSGPIYHTGKVASHHRRVYSGNDSWSATTAKDNLRIFYFDALDELAEYINCYFEKKVSYEGFKIKMTITSLYLYFLKRTPESFAVFKYMYNNVRYYTFAHLKLIKVFIELPLVRMKIKFSRIKNRHLNKKKVNIQEFEARNGKRN